MGKISLVLVSHTYGGKRSLKDRGTFDDRESAQREMRRLLELSDAEYRVLGPRQLAKLKEEIASEQSARRKAGARKAAEKRKKHGVKFVLCPTCNAKSKKLFSEMGGLQTRKCRNGHLFEVDTFFGFETNKRRVERTDRPFYVGPGVSYNDYVYGRFKDDPSGKGVKR